MSSRPAPSLVAVFVAAFFAASGLGYGVGRAVPATSAPADTAASSTPTTEPPTTEPPTTEPPTTTSAASIPTTTGAAVAHPPLRVLMAGDSVMSGLAPAVAAAFGSQAADVRFVLTPTVGRDATVRYTWQHQIDNFDPDVVVMLVGTWESGVVSASNEAGVGRDVWRVSYGADTLDPWVRLSSSRGARVIWIGNPTVGSVGATALFGVLNEAFRELPSRWSQVTYLDSDASLHGPQRGFSPVISTPDGHLLRTRQTDLLHLCPDGAALLGAQVAEEIAREFPVEVIDGWEAGPWRGDLVYPIEGCPPS